jgi:hypothetical protein
VANKRKIKKRWLKTLLLYIFFPVFVWLSAFFIWLNWNDLPAFFGKKTARAKPAAQAGRDDKPQRVPAKRPQETILDEDRKQLEDILKRR